MPDGPVLQEPPVPPIPSQPHASRRRERQARRTVTLIAAVVATRWICGDLAAVAWPIQAASVVGFAVLFTGIAEFVRGES